MSRHVITTAYGLVRRRADFSADPRHVFSAAAPYALVEFLGSIGPEGPSGLAYATYPASTIEDALVSCDERLQAGAEAWRFQVYLRCVYGFGWVHSVASGEWPSHEQRLATLEWRRAELDFKKLEAEARRQTTRAALATVGPPASLPPLPLPPSERADRERLARERDEFARASRP